MIVLTVFSSLLQIKWNSVWSIIKSKLLVRSYFFQFGRKWTSISPKEKTRLDQINTAREMDFRFCETKRNLMNPTIVLLIMRQNIQSSVWFKLKIVYMALSILTICRPPLRKKSSFHFLVQNDGQCSETNEKDNLPILCDFQFLRYGRFLIIPIHL